jgi:hypothetical protein
MAAWRLLDLDRLPWPQQEGSALGAILQERHPPPRLLMQVGA